MEGYFVPECYFDTVLVKAILKEKLIVNHKKGCNNVIKSMSDGRLKDQFAVGIIDKDKNKLDYLKKFDMYEFPPHLILYNYKKKNHFVIQLSPPLEEWLLMVTIEAKINIVEYGLPSDIEKLKKITKSELADESNELRDLCNALLSSQSETIKRFANWIRYFRDKKHQSDINELLNA